MAPIGSTVYLEQTTVLPEPSHMSTVETDELIISSTIVWSANNMDSSSLKAPLFTNLNASRFFCYFGVAVVHRPFITSGLPGDNRFRVVEAPMIVGITEDFSRTEFLFLNKFCKSVICAASSNAQFLFGLSEELLDSNQNIMIRFPVPIVPGLQSLPSFVQIAVIKNKLIKIGKFAEILCLFLANSVP